MEIMFCSFLHAWSLIKTLKKAFSPFSAFQQG